MNVFWIILNSKSSLIILLFLSHFQTKVVNSWSSNSIKLNLEVNSNSSQQEQVLVTITYGSDDGERVEEGGGEAPLPGGAASVPALVHRRHDRALVVHQLRADPKGDMYAGK